MARFFFFMAVVLAFTAFPVFLLRRSFPEAWKRWMSKAVLAAFLGGGAGLVIWQLALRAGFKGLSVGGLTVTSLVVVAGLLLAFSSWLWTPLAGLARRQAAAHDGLADPSRRRFLSGAAAAVPASAAAISPVGTAAAMSDPVIKEVQIKVKGLPEGLDGLRILQLTDIHLGTWIDPDQVKTALAAASPYEPELILLTGDLADDYTKLPEALAAVGEANAPLGAYACIGNHEIYRGRRQFEQIIKDSPVSYLCSSGVLVERGGDRLWLAGSDDPARMGIDVRPFIGRSIDEALKQRPEGVTTTVLLSHRPEGFDPAAERGITLTLAGHTHGGQMAFLGRFIFEFLVPDRYMLGTYKRGGSHLYTSAGLGHWLPFRVGCPCEGALITLRRA